MQLLYKYIYRDIIFKCVKVSQNNALSNGCIITIVLYYSYYLKNRGNGSWLMGPFPKAITGYALIYYFL